MADSRKLAKIAIVLGMVIVLIAIAAATLAVFAEGEPAAAAQTEQVTDTASLNGLKAIGSGIAIGFAACGGAIGMGIIGGKTVEGIARQPEIDGKIRTNFMLGLVFIETAIIYALLVVILIIFVL